MPETSDTTGRQAIPVEGAAGADGIGRRLAAHRARRGVRVAELARDVGVTPSLISQIERGQSRPSVSTLFALAEALRVPVDAFFRESADPEGPEVPADPAAGRAGSPERSRPYDVQAQSYASELLFYADQSRAREEEARPREEEAADDVVRGDGRYMVRRDTRAVVDIEGGVRWERLTRNQMDHLDFFELIYAPGAESHPRQYTHPGTEMLLVTRGLLEITVGFERYRLGPGDSIDFPSSMPHRYVNPGDETARAVTVILYECPAARDGTAREGTARDGTARDCGPGSGHPAP